MDVVVRADDRFETLDKFVGSNQARHCHPAIYTGQCHAVCHRVFFMPIVRFYESQPQAELSYPELDRRLAVC